MKLQLLDSRRLTGANLYWERPSAVIDAAIEGRPNLVVERWHRAAHRLLESVGHAHQLTCHRLFRGGASLLISAPIDALYSMCELNEVAWQLAMHESGAGEAPDVPGSIDRLTALFTAESRPRLLAVQQAARQHGFPFLCDDETVSVGYGAGCTVWPRDEVPEPEAIDWQSCGTVPLGLVTGTNGKSTTVRMAAAIMAAAGLRGGMTSTDFIRVGQRVVATGDYSGTGGARRLLREKEVEAAVLEVARGGLLRRGLGVERADAALITNVAADHLGEYGMNTVEELRAAKFIVRRALGPADPLILNADDAGLAAHAERLDNRCWWFGPDPDQARLRAARAAGEGACWVKAGWIVSTAVRLDGAGEPRRIVEVAALPATHGGRVRHNVQNALGACLLATALGLPDDAIRSGLLAFRGDESDNPGRCNWFEHEGITIIVDFAHNEHGLRALAQTVTGLAAQRLILLLGQAGDRSDDAIRGMAQAACSMLPDRLLVFRLPGYERGRALAEVPALMRAEALRLGLDAGAIAEFSSPLEAASAALADARKGDVIVLLALTQRAEILHKVHEFIHG